MVYLQKVVMMGAGTLAFLSFQRKWRHWLAFLVSDVVLVVQERSSVMCMPWILVLLTLLTVAMLIVRGACWVCVLLKSTTISFDIYMVFGSISMVKGTLGLV